MKTNIKNRSFITLIAVVVLAFAGALVSFLAINGTAHADSTKFTMRGASIRYQISDKDDGIRFHLVMDKAQYDSLGSKQTGMLIIPKYKLGSATLTKDTAGVYNTINNGTLTWNTINEPDAKYGETATDMEAVVVVKGFASSEDYYNMQLVVRGFIKDGSNYTYTTNTTTKSLADVAYEQNIATYVLTYTVKFYSGNTVISTQQVKFGQQFDFPSIDLQGDSTLAGWYKRTGGTSTPVWSSTSTAQADISRTVTKNAEYKANIVGDAYVSVSYSSTIYNKEHIKDGDPSVQYRDGFYYVVSTDSKLNMYITKSRTLEDLLHVGPRLTYGQMYSSIIYAPTSSSQLGADIWAPELTYIRGKWYIYVCGVPFGSTHLTTYERMFVMECSSQDPTDASAWGAPIQLTTFGKHYAIDGHAFEYKNQLYYVFSGDENDQDDTDSTKPQLYICKMSSPTALTGDFSRINLDTKKKYSWSSTRVEDLSKLKEGPCTVVDGNDLYLVFSMGGHDGSEYNSSNDYHLCYYKLTGSNPLTKSDWTDKGTCLEHDTSKGVYTVGHNHFFKNADGTLWTSYHGILYDELKGGTANRRVFVQPVTVSNGALNFGGVKTEVSVTEKGGLQENTVVANSYMIDCGTSDDNYEIEGAKSYGTLWHNNGGNFSVSTVITRMNDGQFCAGVTLYERSGGKTNRLLIGVGKEGNLFFCKDYSRMPLNYKYAGWLWNDRASVRLKVVYTAANQTFKITLSDATGQSTKSGTYTYTLAQINELVSDAVSGTTKAFDLAFTGNFGIGLGGNKNKVKFTNVQFDNSLMVDLDWNSSWGDTWDPYS